jgi:hypothetical protein
MALGFFAGRRLGGRTWCLVGVAADVLPSLLASDYTIPE